MYLSRAVLLLLPSLLSCSGPEASDGEVWSIGASTGRLKGLSGCECSFETRLATPEDGVVGLIPGARITCLDSTGPLGDFVAIYLRLKPRRAFVTGELSSYEEADYLPVRAETVVGERDTFKIDGYERPYRVFYIPQLVLLDPTPSRISDMRILCDSRIFDEPGAAFYDKIDLDTPDAVIP